MVVDKLENIGKYPQIIRNSESLKGFFAKKPVFEEGKEVNIPNSDYKFSPFRFEVTPAKEKRWEIHHKQNDIHIAVSGRECIGWLPAEMLKETTGYTEDNDCEFFTDQIDGSFVVLEEGWFAILEPKDAHRPSINENGVNGGVKIVIKADIL